MSKIYRYMVRFNNRVGNTYAHRIEDALHDAKSLVSYKLAGAAHILERQADGTFKVVDFVAGK